jgi:hypothetical protein
MSDDSTKYRTVFLFAMIAPDNPNAFMPICYGWSYHNKIQAAENGELMMRMDWMAMRNHPNPNTGTVDLQFPPPSMTWFLTPEQFDGVKPFQRPEVQPNVLFRLIWMQPAETLSLDIKPETSNERKIIIPDIVPPSDIINMKDRRR